MKKLTQGNETRQILTFSIPLVIGNLFQNLYSIVDSVVVGRYIGSEALAAVGASFPIIFTLISLVIGIGSGASTVISQFFGANDNKSVRKTIDTILVFFLVASILVTGIGIAIAKPLFLLLRLPLEVLPEALSYLYIYLSGMFAFFGFNGISSILRGLGDSRTPLKYMVISTLVNIVLDLFFVIVLKWGIAAVAFATIIAHFGAFVTAIVHLNRSHEIVRIRLRPSFDKAIFSECIRIGLPTGFQQSFVAIGMMLVMGIVNTFGTSAVAAYTAAMRIDAFAKMPALNFSSALSTFVGQNLGAKEERRAKNGLHSTMFISGLYCLAVTLLIVFFGNALMKMFTEDLEIIAIGNQYLVIVSSFYLFFSIMFSGMGFLRGAGDTVIPMFTTIVSLWLIRLPLSWGLSERMGVEGVFWAIPIAWIVGALFTIIYYKTSRWRGKTVKLRY